MICCSQVQIVEECLSDWRISLNDVLVPGGYDAPVVHGVEGRMLQ